MSERMGDYAPGGAPFTGRKMLKVMLAFFGVILLANGAMTFFALSNFRGTVVDSGFVASQDFNATRAAAEAQAARGWGMAVSAPGAMPLVALTGPDGAPLTGLRVRGAALRPLDERMDTPLAFIETAPGLYAAREALAPGRWRIALTAEGEGAPFRHSTPLMIPADR
jgi:nitrogen fixation protein FixH